MRPVMLAIKNCYLRLCSVVANVKVLHFGKQRDLRQQATLAEYQ